jgi:hypothetical protein
MKVIQSNTFPLFEDYDFETIPKEYPSRPTTIELFKKTNRIPAIRFGEALKECVIIFDIPSCFKSKIPFDQVYQFIRSKFDILSRPDSYVFRSQLEAFKNGTLFNYCIFNSVYDFKNWLRNWLRKCCILKSVNNFPKLQKFIQEYK